MNRKNVSVVTIGAMAVLSAGFAASALTQNQPNTPPRNQPGQNQPGQNQPGQNQPGQTNPSDRTQPTDRNQPSDRSIQPTDRPIQPGDRRTTNANRYNRPFAFESPDYENRFNESSRRLVKLEQKLATQNQELMRRLGEARQLSGERQNAAMFDLMQQMLRDQQAVHEYLVQSRTAWTGDLEDPTLSNPSDPTRPVDPARPTTPTTPTPTNPNNPTPPTPR